MDNQEALYERIKSVPLFAGLDRAQVLFLLNYLDARFEVLEKGRMVFPLAETINSFALILGGSVELAQHDYWGNRSIILTQEAGESIGLPSALLEGWVPPADVVVRSRCELLFFEAPKLRVPEHAALTECALLKTNIAKQLVFKNYALLKKISLVNRRSTREKVSLFLSQKAAQCRSSCFDIEFTRQEMADFLSVNRCALSKELARMQRDGLIEYDYNHFELKSLKETDRYL